MLKIHYILRKHSKGIKFYKKTFQNEDLQEVEAKMLFKLPSIIGFMKCLNIKNNNFE
jgi:hypothetical protein